MVVNPTIGTAKHPYKNLSFFGSHPALHMNFSSCLVYPSDSASKVLRQQRLSGIVGGTAVKSSANLGQMHLLGAETNYGAVSASCPAH